MRIMHRRAMIGIYRGEHYITMLSFDATIETTFLRKLTEQSTRIGL